MNLLRKGAVPVGREEDVFQESFSFLTLINKANQNKKV